MAGGQRRQALVAGDSERDTVLPGLGSSAALWGVTIPTAQDMEDINLLF